jgi:hypothetical protein
MKQKYDEKCISVQDIDAIIAMLKLVVLMLGK